MQEVSCVTILHCMFSFDDLTNILSFFFFFFFLGGGGGGGGGLQSK